MTFCETFVAVLSFRQNQSFKVVSIESIGIYSLVYSTCLGHVEGSLRSWFVIEFFKIKLFSSPKNMPLKKIIIIMKKKIMRHWSFLKLISSLCSTNCSETFVVIFFRNESVKVFAFWKFEISHKEESIHLCLRTVCLYHIEWSTVPIWNYLSGFYRNRKGAPERNGLDISGVCQSLPDN